MKHKDSLRGRTYDKKRQLRNLLVTSNLTLFNSFDVKFFCCKSIKLQSRSVML